jgi:hypothetical protein
MNKKMKYIIIAKSRIIVTKDISYNDLDYLINQILKESKKIIVQPIITEELFT